MDDHTSLGERIAALESRMAAVERALVGLAQELRNDRVHLDARVRELESWRHAHNAVNAYHRHQEASQREVALALLALVGAALFGGGGLVAALIAILK